RDSHIFLWIPEKPRTAAPRPLAGVSASSIRTEVAGALQLSRRNRLTGRVPFAEIQRRRASEFGQPAFEGISHEAGGVMDVQLLHNLRAVGFAGADRDPHEMGHLFGGVTFRD